MLISQSCLILCDPTDSSPPGSSIHGILQARIVEWVAFSFSRGSSQPRDWTQVCHIAGSFLTVWASRGTQMIKHNSNIRCYQKAYDLEFNGSSPHTHHILKDGDEWHNMLFPPKKKIVLKKRFSKSILTTSAWNLKIEINPVS